MRFVAKVKPKFIKIGQNIVFFIVQTVGLVCRTNTFAVNLLLCILMTLSGTIYNISTNFLKTVQIQVIYANCLLIGKTTHMCIAYENE